MLPLSPPLLFRQACFDSNTGRHSSCTTLKRARENSENNWRAVGLLMTKTHIIVTGSDGSIDWLRLPAQPGGGLEVIFIPRYRCRFNLRLRIRVLLRSGVSIPCRPGSWDHSGEAGTRYRCMLGRDVSLCVLRAVLVEWPNICIFRHHEHDIRRCRVLHPRINFSTVMRSPSTPAMYDPFERKYVNPPG